MYLTVEKDIQIDRKPIGMLAVDAGLHNIATTVNSLERKSRFYGKELRKLRAHFYLLRKALQMNGAYGALKRVGAQWRGIKVIEVSEAWTSQTCHHCLSKGFRVGGKFKCFACGHEYNADYNGAYNIMNRGIGQALSQGLFLAQPISRTR